MAHRHAKSLPDKSKMLGDMLKIIRPMQLAQPSRPSFLNGSAQTDMANEAAKASSTVGQIRQISELVARACCWLFRPTLEKPCLATGTAMQCHGAYSSFEKKEGAEGRRFGLAKVSCRLQLGMRASCFRLQAALPVLMM